MRILLVEDDAMIGEEVRAALREASYAADWVRDGNAAHAALDQQDYDAVLLDLGLPGADGLSVLRQMRRHATTPVLILTARDGVQERIDGLDSGADDYILKPFAMGELLARLRAVMRRKSGAATVVLDNGELSLDLADKTARWQGQAPVTLSAREFALLQALMHRPGAILSRSELEERIYGWGEEVESNAVEFLIHALRKKLDRTAIRNVRGMGWMVAARSKRVMTPLQRSLQARLSLALTLAILLVALGAGVFGFLSAYRDSIRQQDDLLLQVGTLIARLGGTLPADGAEGSYPGADHESRISVQWLPEPGQSLPAATALPLPAGLQDGFQTAVMFHENFRVYVQPLASGRRIALAQETDVRDGIASRSAWRAVIPVLLLVPVLLLALRHIMRTLFAPLAQLRREIDQRRDDQLDPLATQGLPLEISPFVDAINRLLARVQGAMTAQRRFVADAAHELRTPLAALSLQAEGLQQSELSDTARARLQRLEQGLERARMLVTQLLALARAQNQTASSARTRLLLREAVRPVLEDLLPLAQQKDIDLGVDGPLTAEVDSNPVELGLLLGNLIDNAIRYTPPGGCISLALAAAAQTPPGRVRLEISDNGPGIPASERERVFQPFHRLDPAAAPGAGLGLAIVQSVAARLDIMIGLAATDEKSQTGLRVILDIPAPGQA